MKALRAIGEYALTGAERDRHLADASPVSFLLRDVVRAGAIMALLLLVGDAANWGLLNDNPGDRLQFVALWSLAMAVFSLIKTRYRLMERLARRGHAG